MLNAHSGQGDYPRIRTFNETFNEFSTNSVFHDLEQAAKWFVFSLQRRTIERRCSTFRHNMGPEVDIADLTWEQKEQVLRSLFIQMNSRGAMRALPE